MHCLSNCSINDDTERAIACKLCGEIFHIKCVKIQARVADCLNVDSGVYWLCHKCRKIDSKLCTSFSNAKKAFSELSKDLVSIQDKLAKYEKLFSETISLEKEIPKKQSDKKSKKKSSSSIETSGLNIVNDDLILLSPSLDIQNPSTSSAIEPSRAILSEPPSPKNLQNALTYSQVTNSSSTQLPDPGPVPVPVPDRRLKVVIPRKSIFVSRLAEDTSENDITEYLQLKLNNLANFNISECRVKKFKFSYKRSIASFKITLPFSLLKVTLNNSFWPSGTLAHEFISPPKDLTKPIPSLFPASKN